MFTKQSSSNNFLSPKRLCAYGILAATCIIFGFIESLIPFALIAPGIKVGLANSICLFLLTKGDYKGAFAVNITRILLSALLFGSPFSLLFSAVAGIGSMVIVITIKSFLDLSEIGLSVVGAVFHNLIQIAVAYFVLDEGVLFYTPILVASGVITGIAIGFLCKLFLKKIKTNGIF